MMPKYGCYNPNAIRIAFGFSVCLLADKTRLEILVLDHKGKQTHGASSNVQTFGEASGEVEIYIKL
jgi:hypothetical protein